MKAYKWKYMNDEMLQEMGDLLKSEHGATLLLWSKECADAGVKGFVNSIVKGVLLGVVVGGVVGVGKAIKEDVDRKKSTEELVEGGTAVNVDVDI